MGVSLVDFELALDLRFRSLTLSYRGPARNFIIPIRGRKSQRTTDCRINLAVCEALLRECVSRGPLGPGLSSEGCNVQKTRLLVATACPGEYTTRNALIDRACFGGS